MSSSIGTRLSSLKEIISNRRFIIPDYQRGYAWEKEHVKAMLEDIAHMLDAEPEHAHFTGTIVLSPNKEEEIYDIVDGQQRLTTLTIILAGVRDFLPPSEIEEFENSYLLHGPKGNRYPVITLNSGNNDYFEQLIISSKENNHLKPTLDSHKRLESAKDIVAEWLKNIDKKKLINVLLNKLGFIVYAPSTTSEVGVMFEVINNRGKPLSELEKVKNYLIYCCAKLKAKKTREKIDERWSNILISLNKANKTTAVDESSFLRYCSTVFLKLNKETSQHTYEELRKAYEVREALSNDILAEELITSIEDYIDFLETAASWYSEIYSDIESSAKDSFTEERRKLFTQIRSQPRQASIMPLCLAVLTKQNHSEDAELRLLRLLEILNFRVYGARGIVARHDTGQAELFKFAAQYYHNDYSLLSSLNENSKDCTLSSFDDALVGHLVRFIEKHSERDRFLKTFTLEKGDPFDFYRWNSLKYFLINYESHVNPNRTIDIKSILSKRKDGKSLDYKSVEHIWSTKYREKENSRAVDSHERRRLGNFLLLELRSNIQVADWSLEKKIEAYLDGVYKDGNEIEPNSELVQVRIAAKLAKSVLEELEGVTRSKDKYFLRQYRMLNDAREKQFREFAMIRWGLNDFK